MDLLRRIKMTTETIVVNMLVFDELVKEGKRQLDFFEGLSQLAIKKIEIRRDYIKEESEFKDLNEAAKKYGFELLYSVPELLYTDQMMTETELRLYAKEAYALGAKHLKFGAGYVKEVSTEDVVILNNVLNEYEINHFTIENGQESYSTADKLNQISIQLIEKGAAVSLTFDTGNFMYVHEDPVKNAKLLKTNVTYVHLKDIKAGTLEMTLLNEGDISIAEVLKAFPSDINIVIEYPCGHDPLDVLKKEIDKLTAIKEAIEKLR